MSLGNSDGKLYSFNYKNMYYNSGTKFIFNGKCLLNGVEVILKHQECEFLYIKGLMVYFKHDGNIYTCLWNDFNWRIYGIIKETVQPKPVAEQLDIKTEFYWTDSMVAKTIWYIIIMLIAIIFNDFICIWIMATVIWYCSVFKKK